MALKKLFGKKLRELRIKKGLKQHELADLMDFETNSLGQVECGLKGVSFKAIENIKNGLDISYYELFDFEETHTSNSIEKSIIRELNGLELDTQKYILKSIKDLKELLKE